jgi:hypothetical protein
MFAYDHLPEDLQAVSKPFGDLATQHLTSPEGRGNPLAEELAFKLWEAKNLAVLIAARCKD